MEPSAPAKAATQRFTPEQCAYLQQSFERLKGRLNSEVTATICAAAQLSKKQVTDWFCRARKKQKCSADPVSDAAQQHRQPLAEMPQNMQQQQYIQQQQQDRFQQNQQQQQQQRHLVVQQAPLHIYNDFNATDGPARAVHHQQTLNQPSSFLEERQRNRLAFSSQLPAIPSGWEDAEWSQLVSDVHCLLNGEMLSEVKFEEIKALLQEGSTYKHDLHAMEIALCLGPALQKAKQPVAAVTEQEALEWLASSVAALPAYVSFWDPEVRLKLSSLGAWENGELAAMTPVGRWFILQILQTLAELRRQHTHAGNPLKELCQAFQQFRTGQQWQQISDLVQRDTPLTSWHLQVMAQTMLDQHLQAVYLGKSAFHASQPADVSPITPTQAAVAYYCGGWAIRTTLQALCRLKQPDQALIHAFRQTFTDQPEQLLPEAFLTEERSRGKLLYVKQPIFDVILAIELETRRHFTDILHLHSNSYNNLRVSLEESVALRTQWCSACIIVDIPAFDEADMAVISSMYAKFITKWMHMRQKEMLALFALKANAPQHADALRGQLKNAKGPAAKSTGLQITAELLASVEPLHAHNLMRAAASQSSAGLSSLKLAEVKCLLRAYSPVMQVRGTAKEPFIMELSRQLTATSACPTALHQALSDLAKPK